MNIFNNLLISGIRGCNFVMDNNRDNYDFVLQGRRKKMDYTSAYSIFSLGNFRWKPQLGDLPS